MDTDRESIERAAGLMTEFAARTGLTLERPPRRYLWTDAFAVCNFLALARETGEARYTELALALVDQVHHVLGRHRADDPRAGWISGLDEREGEAHPTRGGLRIGKKLPERGPEQPCDERLEWDRDGQYFHYLTKWMHALDQVSGTTGDPRYARWARELAAVAHAAFVQEPRGASVRRMVWKMSTDLSRPLVPSMGQHDPLDGYITCIQLESTALRLSGTADGPGLTQAITDFAALIATTDVRTIDPLGLGGLLTDAWRVAQLMTRGAIEDVAFLEGLLAATEEGLALYARHGDWRHPAARRLAFRELGLAIGLFGLERLQRQVEEDRHRVLASPELRVRVQSLAPQVALGSTLAAFWLDPAHRAPRTWSEHRDINEVMLATSLIPDGYLVLPSGLERS